MEEDRKFSKNSKLGWRTRAGSLVKPDELHVFPDGQIVVCLKGALPVLYSEGGGSYEPGCNHAWDLYDIKPEPESVDWSLIDDKFKWLYRGTISDKEFSPSLVKGRFVPNSRGMVYDVTFMKSYERGTAPEEEMKPIKRPEGK